MVHKVTSSQTHPHADLNKLVKKHLARPFQKPIPPHTQQAFDKVKDHFETYQNNWILDSGCGVGESTIRIALEHPSFFVIGVDKSSHRLCKNEHYAKQLWPAGKKKNWLLVQADLIGFWQLLRENGICAQKHYLLYPNPHPKPAQIKRRWHGHPIFPTLIRLSPYLEIRSNWRLYLEEFSLACKWADLSSAAVKKFMTDHPLTPFEKNTG